MVSKPIVPLGSVLVTGGCGFLGTHLVKSLLKDPSCTSITVLDRAAPRTPLDKVIYIEGSVTSLGDIRSALLSSNARVVFHTASPNVTFPTSKNDFYSTNVDGTRLMLESSKQYGVKAFVFTSSADAYADPPHDNISESHRLWSEKDRGKIGPYPLSKAVADQLVLAGATEDFPTVSLRGTHLYGDGDTHAIPVALDACSGSKPLFQMGDGQNLMEIISTENSSSAHILAAKALLNPSLARGKFNGEAFNISDGNPAKFWRFFEIIWGTARGRDVKPEMWIIPAGLILFLVGVIEWIFWIFTLGTIVPKGLNQLERQMMVYCLENHSYDSSKFREALGWKPVGNWEEVLAAATRWEMRRKQGKKGR